VQVAGTDIVGRGGKINFGVESRPTSLRDRQARQAGVVDGPAPEEGRRLDRHRPRDPGNSAATPNFTEAY